MALLYDESLFSVHFTEKFSLELFDDEGLPDYTRDIILVTGELQGHLIHVIVNHWSSRREGEKETEHKRLSGSNKVAEIISSITLNNRHAKILVIGDFNDEPHNKSIKRLVKAYGLYNAIEPFQAFNRGTARHQRQWLLFDQILMSKNFLKEKSKALQLDSANIFDEDFLKIFKGKYKGAPFRTYVGKKYKGGYSDHFPVYVVLKTPKLIDK